jgi:hypothetical protein
VKRKTEDFAEPHFILFSSSTDFYPSYNHIYFNIKCSADVKRAWEILSEKIRITAKLN